MARLSASERAKLADSAFAYVDSKGERRLPINDESHVRNALSRFGQVRFESESARQKARRRLLQAAKRHGIVPVGFIDGELRTGSRQSAAGRLIIELGRIESSADLRPSCGARSAIRLFVCFAGRRPKALTSDATASRRLCPGQHRLNRPRSSRVAEGRSWPSCTIDPCCSLPRSPRL